MDRAEDVSKGKAPDLTKSPMPGDEPIDTTQHEDDMFGDLAGTDRIIHQMHHRIHSAYDYWWPIYQAAERDVTFTYEEQWDAEARAERDKRKQPTLSFHVLPNHVNVQCGQIRESGFPVNVTQKGGMTGQRPSIPIKQGGAMPGQAMPGMFEGEGVQMVPFPEIIAGLIRDTEYRSNAKVHYDYAAQHAIEGGFGFLRILTVQPHDNPFVIEPKIEHIDDRWSVMFDHAAEAPDLSDAMWCVHSKRLTRADFRARYPDARVPSSDFFARFGSSGYDLQSWWHDSDFVRVCEYWYKEPMERTALMFRAPNGEVLVDYEDNLVDTIEHMEALGLEKVKEKKVKSYVVKMMRCTATHILDKPVKWPTMSIPIVPVFGRVVSLHGRRHMIGLIRYAKDPIQAANYHFSALVERASRSPHTQWMASSDQIAGVEELWNESSVLKRDVLIYNSTEERHPPQRIEPQQLPIADLNIFMSSMQLVMDAIGQHAASLGKPSNETSGVAIQQRQAAGALANNIFRANLAFAITTLRNQLVELFPRIYKEDTVRRIMGVDGQQALVAINEEIDGHLVSSLNLGRYGCEVQIAPSPMEQAQQQAAQAMQTEAEATMATAQATIAKAKSDSEVAAVRLEMTNVKLATEKEKTVNSGLEHEQNLEIKQKEVEKRQKDIEGKAHQQEGERQKQEGERTKQERQLEGERLKQGGEQIKQQGERDKQDRQMQSEQQKQEAKLPSKDELARMITAAVREEVARQNVAGRKKS